jgi:hypothetical protein
MAFWAKNRLRLPAFTWTDLTDNKKPVRKTKHSKIIQASFVNELLQMPKLLLPHPLREENHLPA